MDFDAIVIGSGQAGVPLATRLTRSGRKVLLAERGALGGTCVNTGCTPTKTLVASARAAHVARTARRLGVLVESVEVDFLRSSRGRTGSCADGKRASPGASPTPVRTSGSSLGRRGSSASGPWRWTASATAPRR